MDTWNRLPPALQSLVLGTLLDGAFLALLRLARGRFERVGPLLDRFGPKAARDPHARRTPAGCGPALAGLAVSWLIAHEALRGRHWIVSHLVHR